MTKRVAIVLTLVASLVLALAADAAARRLHPQPRIHKASTSPAPSIRKVTPLKANVGEKLTILGKNFKGKKTRVFFLRQGGGVTSTKPEYATKTRLVVTIPETVTPLLRDTGANATKTRFQIRLLTSRYGTATKKSLSPLIGPASTSGGGGNPGGGSGNPGDGDCDGDSVKNKNETDDDNDLINDGVEVGTTHTDPCKADTDGDTISDGYEWQSAKDMNDTTPFNVPNAALPYPGKKPWPNPLDPSDKFNDHDGDGLSMSDEYQLFRFYGSHTLPLNYSDGLQISQNVLAPVAPVRWYMDMNGDGILSDDERDADGDNLGNWDEAYGRMTANWWDDEYSGQNGKPKESHYPAMTGGGVAWIETSLTDPDTDGDGIADGADDQDHDGLSNAFEIERPPFWNWTYVSLGPNKSHDGVLTDDPTIDNEPQDIVDDYNAFAQYPVVDPNPWARVQPYNPCKPVWSKTCHLHWPGGYYGDDEDWIGPDPRYLKLPPAAPWLYQGEL
ncbi:MAG TPA: hypothetical protein VJT75_17845 [Thermoleophilaceae bacterium]|nr:hypothetical protein [Thermoleophilaceae bacterium]